MEDRNLSRMMLVLLGGCLALGSCQNPRSDGPHLAPMDLVPGSGDSAASMASYKQGVEAADAGDLDEAHKQLKVSVAESDRNALAWMELGIIEYERDNLFEAAYAFHRASILEPTRYEPHYNMGIILESVGRYQKAIAAYKRALKLAPDQIEVMENLARCYIRTDTDLDEAQTLIGKARPLERRLEWQEWLETQAQRLEQRKERER